MDNLFGEKISKGVTSRKMLKLHFHSFARIMQTSEVIGIKVRLCFSANNLFFKSLFILLSSCFKLIRTVRAASGLFFPNKPFYPKKGLAKEAILPFFFLGEAGVKVETI